MATDYPVKVRWRNDSKSLSRFLTRTLEPLEGEPEEMRDQWSLDELNTVAEAVAGRQKTNVVIQNEREHELVIDLLKQHAQGIGHPGHGGKWATNRTHRAVKRVIDELENYEH